MKNLILIAACILGFQAAQAKEEIQTIPLQVTEKGFEPSEIKVKPGTHVVLKVTRKTDKTCATEIVIKERKIKTELPLNKEVSVDVGVLQKGDIRFACGMNMLSGHLIVK